jgi:hypothetical protein
MILVRFAIASCLSASRERLLVLHESSLPKCRRKVLWSAVIISDDFSVSC